MTDRHGPLIGDAMGLEHVVYLVRDLRRASVDFQETLGLAPSPGIPHSNGTIDSSVCFADGTYRELLGIRDPYRDTPSVGELKRFLARREGPIAIGVRVSSAARAAAFLGRRGYDVSGPHDTTFPDPKTGKPSPPMYSNVEIAGHRPYLDDLVFFCEEIEGNWEAFVASSPQAAAVESATIKEQTKTAVRLSSVWLAVESLKEARAVYASIGLDSPREGALPLLAADAAEVSLGQGSMLLVQARSSSGPVTEFLSRYGEPAGMIGVSLEVRDLEKARSLIPSRALIQPTTCAGWSGKSLLVSPTHAHGAWLELFERPSGA